MQDDILAQIGSQIRERRKHMGITVQQLAAKASVSKGLISQIENNRVVPSLMVLIDIIRALDMDLNLFFKEIETVHARKAILIRRKEDYTALEKEQAMGMHHHQILTKNMKRSRVDITLIALEANANKTMMETLALQYNYIVGGKISYKFAEEDVLLEEGDSLLFNGVPHTLRNRGAHKGIILCVSFFEEDSD